MTPVLELMLVLAIIVGLAKASGYLSTRAGQPAVLGELLIGLLLGPSLLNLLNWPIFHAEHTGEVITQLAELGVLFLMFIAGLEVELETMRQSGRPALFAGTIGVLVPIVLALGLTPVGFVLERSIFIGIVLAATSVSISAQTLIELGMIRSPVGVALLGAAVIDDVLVILALSLFTALVGENATGGWQDIAWVVLKMILFTGIALRLGMWLVPRGSDLADRLPISQGLLSFAVVVTLLYAWSAETLGGIAAITGAFLAGLLFARTPYRRRIDPGIQAIAYTWLVPVFFVNIGLEANIREIGWHGLPLALLILAIAVLSKLIGSGLGARLGGFNSRDALRLGVGMISRGEVGLIVASVGLRAGLIDQEIFASVILMVIATTLLTPILLRALYPQAKEAAAPAPGPMEAASSTSAPLPHSAPPPPEAEGQGQQGGT